MQINILTLFPNMISAPLSESIIGRAIARNLLKVNVRDIRNYSQDKHRAVDDYIYGGGPGMLLKPEPLFEAISALRAESPNKPLQVILMSPQGRTFDQTMARQLLECDRLALICGHYEGVDERVRQHLIDDEISIGDYILTGGELPALVITDAIARLLPGVLGDPESPQLDSFTSGLLQEPEYTRPENYQGLKVPRVLLSGNHQAIAQWRRNQSIKKTAQRRPDLLTNANIRQKEINDALLTDD